MVDLKAVTLTCTEASQLAAEGESIELTSFGESEIPDIVKMQNGLKNLRDLLKTDLTDIAKFITNPPKGLVDFKRIAAQFAVGGTIAGLTGVSLDYVLHYSDRDDNGNGGNIGTDNSQDAQGNQHTPTAAATVTSSTATPTAWLLNTVFGTSRESFEAFVSKLPDRGSGKRIIFPAVGYQNYVTKMTLEEAKAASKNPIVDQVYPNDPVDVDMSVPESSAPPRLMTRDEHNRSAVSDGHQYERRAGSELVTVPIASPLHLKFISLAKDKRSHDQNEYDNALDTQYTYEKSGGAGTHIYVLDGGFDVSHPVSIILPNLQTSLDFQYRNIRVD